MADNLMVLISKFMLPRSYRLTKRKDFQEIYRTGRSVGGKLLSVKFKPNDRGHIRAGVVVSKKAVQKAVARNKTKRRIRQIIRSDIMGSQKGYDLAVVVRRLPEEVSYQELQAEWQQIWSQLKL